MKRYFYYITFAALFATSCHGQKKIVSDSADTDVTSGTKRLRTYLALESKPKSKDSVRLIFTVVNPTGEKTKFCKWETPFEPKLGKYFEIKDQKGREALFKGAMARRIMPPPPEAYIEVPAHDSVRTVINLAEYYSFNNNKYTLIYTGSGISGLKSRRSLDINLEQR